ncbi:MAG TPA: hypothetical protein VHE54_06935 [Puia sp.]|nr:hypothetical protein [Puia sp.]
MGRRAGRPRKPNGRTKHISFPTTELEDAVIRRKVEKSGLILADYMRQVAVHGEVRVRWTEEERQTVKTLIGLSVDIHRLAETAKEQAAAQTAVLFLKYRGIMDEIIHQLCHDR